MNKPYLFDSNIFIQSKNLYYAFDIAPSFWEKLNILAEKKVFSIIARVKKELTPSTKNPDEINVWIRNDYKGEVLSTNDPLVLEKYFEITQNILLQQ